MKPSKLHDAQGGVRHQAGEEGTPVSEVCRKARISQDGYGICLPLTELVQRNCSRRGVVIAYS